MPGICPSSVIFPTVALLEIRAAALIGSERNMKRVKKSPLLRCGKGFGQEAGNPDKPGRTESEISSPQGK